MVTQQEGLGLGPAVGQKRVSSLCVVEELSIQKKGKKEINKVAWTSIVYSLQHAIEGNIFQQDIHLESSWACINK